MKKNIKEKKPEIIINKVLILTLIQLKCIQAIKN